MTKKYRLLAPDGTTYLSPHKGLYGGHQGGRGYGTMTCRAALHAIARGGYVRHRVFFADEDAAVAAGYRPCAACLPERYARWKRLCQQDGLSPLVRRRALRAPLLARYRSDIAGDVLAPPEPALLSAVLSYLGVTAAPPSLAHLEGLLVAYARRVPWESVSRIVRRAQIADLAACPRAPTVFWESALAHGTGGTCYESNLAFLTVLRALGYSAALTLNNMGQTVGCHTALIVPLAGARWVVDAGYPILAPLRLDPDQVTVRETAFGRYTVTPTAPERYRIEMPQIPQPYLFDLVDAPVDPDTYWRVTTADYGPGGFFLDRAIIRKAIGDAQWRFDSAVVPPVLQLLADNTRTDQPIDGDLVDTLGAHFGMTPALIAAALALSALTPSPSPAPGRGVADRSG